jgi:hypothetical protein
MLRPVPATEYINNAGVQTELKASYMPPGPDFDIFQVYIVGMWNTFILHL